MPTGVEIIDHNDYQQIKWKGMFTTLDFDKLVPQIIYNLLSDFKENHLCVK